MLGNVEPSDGITPLFVFLYLSRSQLNNLKQLSPEVEVASGGHSSSREGR